MTDSATPKKEQRAPLAAWLEAHKNPELSMDEKHALRMQARWVDQSLRHMVFRALVSRENPRMVDPNEFLTVDSSFTVGALELPVYRFEMNGVVIKLRHNLEDWCVRLWNAPGALVSSYLSEALLTGDYSGIVEEDTEPSGEFCVNCPEHVYAVLWDALTAHREAVEAGHIGVLREMAEEVRTEGSSKSEGERADLERSFRQKLSDAIDMITTSIDGLMDDEPDIAAANELLCQVYNGLRPQAAAVLDTPQEQEAADDVPNGNNHYIVTGRFECSDDNTRYVLAPTAMDAEDKFRAWLVHESQAAEKDESVYKATDSTDTSGSEPATDRQAADQDLLDSVIVALVVQIPGPPIAIYAEDVEENPEPLL